MSQMPVAGMKYFYDFTILFFQMYIEYGRYAILFKNLFTKNWEFSDF